MALLALAGSAHAAEQPAALARAFSGDGAFSFRVDLRGPWPVLGRTSYFWNPKELRRPHPAYRGVADWLVTLALDSAPGPGAASRSATWVRQRATFNLRGGKKAAITFTRLSPAVLVESEGQEIALAPPAGAAGTEGGQAGAGLRYVAFCEGGRVVVLRTADLARGRPVALEEPWIVAWYGSAAAISGYAEPFDINDRTGVDRDRLNSGFCQRLDLPLLIRSERKPRELRWTDGALRISFAGPAGKLALMPLFGGQVFLGEETEAWARKLPAAVVEQARRWARALRDFPVDVAESVAPGAGDELRIVQQFAWESFQDDWGTAEQYAAPVPPMLALAVGGGFPARFYVNGKEVAPVDYNLMDTPGKALFVEGARGYEYRIGGLGELLKRRKRSPAPREAEELRAKLERRVAEMVQAGHLAPLFYIYGGIGGTWYAHYYWVGTPELAHALYMAYPYLSPALQEKVVRYLRAEWRNYPPFEISERYYDEGAARTPYAIPWEDMGRRKWFAMGRDMFYRRSSFFFDLYRVDEYFELTGDRPEEERLRKKAGELCRELLAGQDWALLGPRRIYSERDLHRLRYFVLQGQATYNRWLAGAIGLVRLAQRFGWAEEERLGRYLCAKLAAARVGQARYVAEMHRMGLVRGDEREDWRTLLHIDTTCAIVGWGAVTAGVHQDQELPPFVDLVEEVGRLLGRYARAECETYLALLDDWVPFWYLSEAPKQGATEHRTCPLQHLNGNVLAQYWVLGKRGEEFVRYVDTSRFLGDLYYLQNLAAALDSFAQGRQ